MKIAAFDLGQHMAVAHNGYGDPRAAHVDLSPKGTRKDRFAECLAWLELVLGQAETVGVDTVCYEMPFARGEAATRSLWGYAGLVEAVATKHGMAVMDNVTNSTIKKHATGSSSASKDDMILAAFTTGYQWDNEHEADAWCLLRYAEQTFTVREPQPCLTASPTTKSSPSSSSRKSSATATPPAAPSGSPPTKSRPAPVSRSIVASRRTLRSRTQTTA